MSRLWRTLAVATCATAWLSACTGADSSGASFGTGMDAAGGESDEGGGDGDGDGDGEGDGDGDGEDGDIKFDTPDGGDGDGDAGDGGEQDGCQKVDFLFVIDNSESMREEQENLANSFPGFIDAIKETVEAQDYHIMVVSTDAATTDVCEQTMCGNIPWWPPPCPGYECDTVLSGCDAELGAGRVLDEGYQPCDVQGDQRYLTQTQPDLDDTFACVAQVGIAGSGMERPMEAMLTALGANHNDPGGCNEGFLRDDAILVVTVITDEEDAGQGQNAESPGDPPDWHQGLIDLKGGNEDAVVVLGLIGPPTEDEKDATKCWGSEVSPRLHEFIDSFGDKGSSGSVCEEDYGPFLLSAVETIDLACDMFVPEG